MNTFNLGACSTVSHKRVSQLTSAARPYRLLLSGNRQATVDYFCTKPSVCSWRVRSRQASMFLRVPGPWSSISHCSTALQLRARLAEAQLWSRAESLAASKCLSRQVHPDGGCRVLNPPGFPSQHSSSIKNTCQSQKVHLGPDSQGSPVLCVGCL